MGGGNPISDVANAVSGVFKSVGQAVSDVVDFGIHVVEGSIKNTTGVIGGIIEGDWNKVVTSAIGLVQTGIAVAAIASGGWGIAAGATMLDSQYNNGKILGNVIREAGRLETDIFGTKNIQNAAMEIQAGLTVLASIYGSYVGVEYLGTFSAVAELQAAIPTEIQNIINIAGYAKSAYAVYDAYNSVVELKAEWEALIAEYERQLQLYLQQAVAAKEQWFDMMTDYDIKNRIMPGGDLFNGGAGSYFYTPTSPHEGAKYMLGMMSDADSSMDDAITLRSQNKQAGGQSYQYTIEGGIKWPTY